MTTYALTVLSPDKELFSGEVISLVLRGHEGDLAVFAGHVPFVTTLRPGKCVVTLSDEKELGGAGFCGKGYKEWVKVSDGGPYIKAKIRLG